MSSASSATSSTLDSFATEGRKFPLWLAGLAMISLPLLVLLHQRLRMLAFDDCYIHLRVARNLIETGRAWINPAERVMATSSPVWTLLLALFRVPYHLQLIPVLEAAFAWGCAVQSYRIVAYGSTSQGWTRRAWALLACASTLVILLPSSVGQMETPFAMFLLLTAARLAMDLRWQFLPLLALAACTRLELLPFYALVLAAWIFYGREWKGPLFSLSIIFAVGAWVAFQFHTLLPNSMHAKRISYGIGSGKVIALIVNQRTRDGILFASIFLLALCLAAGLRNSAFNKHSVRSARLALIAIFLGLLLVTQYIVQHATPFEWYRPLYRIPFLLAVVMTPWLLRSGRMGQLFYLGTHLIALLYFVLAPLVTLPLLVIAGLRPAGPTLSLADPNSESLHATSYLALGPVLTHYCAQGHLMTDEIGGLGWAFPGYIDDAFGIATPRALAFQPLPGGSVHSGVPAAYALQMKPDMIVSYSLLDGQLVDSSDIQKLYLRVALPSSIRLYRNTNLGKGWMGRRTLDLWLRRDAPCDIGAMEASARNAFE